MADVKRITYYTILGLALLSPCAFAQFTFALIGKTQNDSFYQQAYTGCKEFARSKSDLTCVYDGADDYQDVRTQVLIVKEYIDKGIDGLLISTTDSNHLVNGALQYAKQKGIPVVTFDSDLIKQQREFRMAYVGTNNFDFGVALGEAAKKYKSQNPQPICIQSGHYTTPNLNKRIEGVRFALSGNGTKKLNGQSGWIEYERCPLYTLGKRDEALNQLITILNYKTPPIFIAVAGFAQFSEDYIPSLSKYKGDIASQKIKIISADTENIQLKALALGLSTVNIGQKPYQMGMKSTELLYHYVKTGKKPNTDSFYLDFHYCEQSTAMSCINNH
ncbi:substrate-binding domain-containing protein [Pseudoalteromonas luteoviolacea]|uniref:Periplasmic binding protein domain-containing protein n=1 Tax=Pseudoalteromonas luteoviolacea S4054 TaxID=1129367 RepID=A0A0F6A5V9_9GAMM|nr:substrate-binding domain-containing protein [Pseudoalteromonas luteoviolacea]KKE81241.1 hypothetical protein N479_22955 [Pseudoalteromonas luteoviolacea S4054]KZN68996.1 hypothetical protein N481_22905 [Pseudoalteromonas luteoviolacea S4047-1]